MENGSPDVTKLGWANDWEFPRKMMKRMLTRKKNPGPYGNDCLEKKIIFQPNFQQNSIIFQVFFCDM